MGSEKPGVHVTLHSDRKGMLYGPSVEPADPCTPCAVPRSLSPPGLRVPSQVQPSDCARH